MESYDSLVKALRLCQFGECGCGKCRYKELKGDWCTEENHPEFFDCDDKLKLDAAAAIEALEAEVKRLEPKRGEMAEVVRCKDCKHRPTGTGVNHHIEFPDSRCPCQCYEDYWYSWMPSDDWYCGNGEKMEAQDDKV